MTTPPLPQAGARTQTQTQAHALAKHMQRHDLVFEGGHVTWRCVGEGPPLVLLHGGHGAWLHWSRNIEALAQRFKVCLPDLPGYGDSSSPLAPSLEFLLVATQHTLNALLGAKTPTLLAGFSFGGLVAAHLAAQRGGVQALALLGPAGHGGARRPRGALRSWREAQQAGDEAALREVMRHNLHLHMLAGAVDDEALAIHTQACLQTRFHSKTLSRAGGLVNSLRTLSCPVLLLWGEHDVTATPHALAPLFAAQCPQVQTCILNNAGHWVQYEAADQVNLLLMDWLLQTTASPTAREHPMTLLVPGVHEETTPPPHSG